MKPKRGYIRTRHLVPIFKRFDAEFDVQEDEPNGLTVACDYATEIGLKQDPPLDPIYADSIYHTIYRGQQTMLFDTADRLMSAMRLNHLWHTNPDLHADYMEVDLSPDPVVPEEKIAGKCVNGHTRTHANTALDKRGLIFCRHCVRDRNREAKQRLKERKAVKV